MNENSSAWCEETLAKLEEQIKSINNENINRDNVDYLYKLVDVHKDLKNEEYWKEKLDMRYRYGNYLENYGRRTRDSRGRYAEGRYPIRDNYRGDDMMNEMQYSYHEYSEGRDNYGADQATLQSLDKMLQSTKDFMAMLKREAKSQQEVEMIKDTARDIAEM